MFPVRFIQLCGNEIDVIAELRETDAGVVWSRPGGKPVESPEDIAKLEDLLVDPRRSILLLSWGEWTNTYLSVIR